MHNFEPKFGPKRIQLLMAAAFFLAIALLVWLGLRSAPAGAAESYPGQGFLPHDRAWEMVSPPDKNGGDVMSLPAVTRASQECDDDCALSFTSLSAFGDVAGTGVAVQYISRRTGEPSTNGWETHAITPALPSGDFLTNSTAQAFHQLFNDDLTKGVFRSQRPLTSEDPNVEAAANSLYLRSGLNEPGAARSALDELVSPCPGCTVPMDEISSFGQGLFATDASEDFDTILIHTARNLTADSAGSHTKAYKWERGSGLSLVGLIPPGSDISCTGDVPDCEPPASNRGAAAGGVGHASHYKMHSISDDGDQVFFTAPTTGADGTDPIANCFGVCSAYVRDDMGTPTSSDDTTIRLNASERTDCAGDPNCGGDDIPDPAPDPNGTQKALVQDATPDGRYAFFWSREALTDDAPIDQGARSKLYRYDTLKPPTAPDNLTLISADHLVPYQSQDSGSGMIGSSNDGTVVYLVGFLGSGGLANIQRWEEGDGPETIAAVSTESLNQAGQDTAQILPGAGIIGLSDPDDFLGAEVSADGRFLTLPVGAAGESILGYDQGDCSPLVVVLPCRQVYLFDAEANGGGGEFTCASCNPSGATPTSDAEVMSGSPQKGGLGAGAALALNSEVGNRSLSVDGRYLFFTTGEKLVPEDENSPCLQPNQKNPSPCADAYVYDTQTKLVSLLSSGTSDSPSMFVFASEDGADAFIATRERLSAWDIDQNYDIYDARISGGLPEPPVEQTCTDNTGCQGPGSGQPQGDSPGSSGFEGEGNPAPSDEATDCTQAERKLQRLKKRVRKLKRKKERASGKSAEQINRRLKAKRKDRRDAKRVLKACERGGQ